MGGRSNFGGFAGASARSGWTRPGFSAVGAAGGRAFFAAAFDFNFRLVLPDSPLALRTMLFDDVVVFCFADFIGRVAQEMVARVRRSEAGSLLTSGASATAICAENPASIARTTGGRQNRRNTQAPSKISSKITAATHQNDLIGRGGRLGWPNSSRTNSS
jgi:hypothetical protein